MEAGSVPRMECTSGATQASKHRGPALVSLTGGVSQGKCRKLFGIYMSLRNLWFHLAPKTLLLGSQVAFKKSLDIRIPISPTQVPSSIPWFLPTALK